MAEKAGHFWALYFPALLTDVRCGKCTMFRPPHDCTKVRSPVDKDGVCRFFDPEELWLSMN